MLYKYRVVVIGIACFIVGIIITVFWPFKADKTVTPDITDIYTIERKIFVESNISDADYSFGILVDNTDVLQGELVSEETATKTFVIDTKDEVEDDFQLLLIKGDDGDVFKLEKKYQVELGKYKFVYNTTSSTFKKKDIDQTESYNKVHQLKSKDTNSDVVVSDYIAETKATYLSITSSSESYANQYVNFMSGKQRLKYKIHKVYHDEDKITKIVYELEPQAREENIKVFLKVGIGANDVLKQKSLIIDLKPIERVDEDE